MSPQFRKYLKGLSILTIALVLITIVVSFISPEWIYRHVWALFLFLMVVSVAGAKLGNRAIQQNPESSTTIHLGIMSGRLLLAVIYLALFLFFEDKDKLVFVVNFFVLYLCYATFDITGLVTNLRTDFGER